MGGPALKFIKKALRVRRKMWALARAKENALRALAGYSPLVSWWESCYGGCLEIMRETVCRAFCPCCMGKISFKARFCPRKKFCGRCFYEGEYENDVMKNCLGFVIGSGLTLLLYVWLCFSKDYPNSLAAIISCICGVIMIFGMAFSNTVRCIMLLTLPSMFTKKGRTCLLMYATILVFSYPATNISANLKVMADSATCGQSLMLNETMELMQMVSDPLAAVVDKIQEMYDHMKNFAKLLLNAFKALIRAVKEIVGVVAAVMKWLWSIQDICNNQMGKPYNKCMKAFDNAYDDCIERLGFFKFLCKIVKAASHLCELCKIGQILCAVTGAIKGLALDEIKAATVGSIADLSNMFDFGISIEQRYSYNMTQSQSYSDVKESIMKEISNKVNAYVNMLSFFNNFMMLAAFYVIYKSWRYRQNYLSKDKYDNYYITPQVLEIESQRKKLGKDGIFPLKKSENYKYLHLYSIHLTRAETRKIARGLLMWLLTAYNACFYMVSDFGLYWLLRMISGYLDVKTTASLPPFLQLHVDGKGPVADMYRTMVGLLDPLAESGLDIDVSACLPKPHRPQYGVYKLIIGIYCICLILPVFEAYGLRLRRGVAACYYPKREHQRAVWLYNQILFKRGSFFKFARRQIRRKYKDDKEIQVMVDDVFI